MQMIAITKYLNWMKTKKNILCINNTKRGEFVERNETDNNMKMAKNKQN